MKISTQLYNQEVLICSVCKKNPIREYCMTCSQECSKQYKKIYNKQYHQKNNKQYHKKYYQKNKDIKDCTYELLNIFNNKDKKEEK